MIRQYLILFMFFLFLGGCAHQIDTKTTLYDDWKPRLAAQKIWQVEGKLAFISSEERQSANLNWQQTTNSNNLILTTFIGTRILSLKQTANGAELEFDGDEYFDTNAAELLKRLTGFTLPVDNADNWLKGTIDDESLIVDELGRAKQVLWFDNTGKKWQIDYGTYVQNAGYWLPTKLTLKHQQIKIKIQLYDWQFK
ncbi:MAG: lipoprotein insertase outer membrane protein LolB [Pseudoalteromonas distincta]|uniref:lipoprotein insertase outer membrane protein LolB n=1 Tax=Pseudoalteromonas distincta TaxID=77608 RepID=UPI003F973E06